MTFSEAAYFYPEDPSLDFEDVQPPAKTLSLLLKAPNLSREVFALLEKLSMWNHRRNTNCWSTSREETHEDARLGVFGCIVCEQFCVQAYGARTRRVSMLNLN